MTLLHALILGIIEGLTELLPVSSTAHLMLASAVMGIPETEFVKTFLIAVQLGAVVAVGLYYIRRVFRSRLLWKKVLAAFVPTALIGFALYDVVKNVLLENLLVAGIALVVGGIAMILIEVFVEKKEKNEQSEIATTETNRVSAIDPASISYSKAIAIGFVQALALVPGVSRSGATIIGGRLMRINRRALVEFSFLLAIPVIAGATGLDLVKSELVFTSYHTVLTLGVGMAAAGLTTWGVITWFIRYIERHTFVAFGWYRIVAGLVAILFATLR